MNKRIMRLLIEGFIAVTIYVLWRFTGVESHATDLGVTLSFSVLPFIWLGLRHGVSVAIVFATVAGLISSLFANSNLSIIERLLIELTPLLSGGVAGFFAKYTQKTLNNRRLASTRLNIATASLLSTLCYYVIRYVIVPYITSITFQSNIVSLNLIGGWILSALISAVIFILFAHFKPNLLIPKRSKYLSRKETSKLLND